MVVETEFYTLLDVLPTATDDEILKSYRNLARIYHPDRNPDGVDKFQEISEAYKVLSDPDMVNHSKKEFNLPPGVSYHKFVFVRDLVFFYFFTISIWQGVPKQSPLSVWEKLGFF